MRAFGRDLIRGGHYGQRSCEPHLKAEHMAAPTNAAYVKKALANSEPPHMALFCRANRTERCPVSGVRQPCRRNPETAEVDPTRTLGRAVVGQLIALSHSPPLAMC